MKALTIIKGLHYGYKTGDFLYKKLCENRGFFFKGKLIINTIYASISQEKLIDSAKQGNLISNDKYEKERIERLKKRIYIIKYLREIYTILQNNCLIINKEFEIQSFQSGDIELVNTFSSDSDDVNELFKSNLNRCKNFLKNSRENLRFTDFTLKCRVYKKYGKEFKEINFDENCEIKYYDKDKPVFIYKIKIKEVEKSSVFRIFYSISLPNEFEKGVLKTSYNTPIPYLEIIIQRDNYLKKMNIEDFEPSLTKVVGNNKIKYKFDSEKLEDFYYLKKIFKIWYNDWKVKDSDIPKLSLEYSE